MWFYFEIEGLMFFWLVLGFEGRSRISLSKVSEDFLDKYLGVYFLGNLRIDYIL